MKVPTQKIIAMLISLAMIFLVSCMAEAESMPAEEQDQPRGAFAPSFTEEGSTVLVSAERSQGKDLSDFPVPELWNGSIRYETLDEVVLLFESFPHLDDESEVYSLLSELGIHEMEQYHLPNEDTIPEGYTLVQILISPTEFTYYYSNTPEMYEDMSPLARSVTWPQESTLIYHINYQVIDQEQTFYLNGEETDAAHWVMTHEIGDNAHIVFND